MVTDSGPFVQAKCIKLCSKFDSSYNTIFEHGLWPKAAFEPHDNVENFAN